MRYSLAIDIGASSGRHILGHIEGGKLVTEEIYRFANGPIELEVEGKRTMKWDIDRLYEEILTGLSKAKELGRIPETVGIDTWGVDYVLLDKEGNAIEGAYCYRDSRTASAVEAVHALIPFEKLYARTGTQFASYNTLYQLYADKMSGRLSKAVDFLMLPDSFHYRLTNVMCQDYTNAGTTGFLNAETHTWDETILKKLGIPRTLFKAPLSPGATIGHFSNETVQKVGYDAKVILPATHDTASAVVAAPLAEEELPYISSGTWSLLGVEQSVAHTDKASMAANYSNETMPTGGFRFQKNIMGLWLIQQVRHELGDCHSFAELADMARASVVDDRIDVDDARFLAPESMIGEITAAVGRELSVGELAYCIFASLAEGYQKSLDALEAVTGRHYDTLNIIGGGCQNILLNELTAKATGKRILAGPPECTAIGNLLMQLIGKGELADINMGRRLVAATFPIITYEGERI